MINVIILTKNVYLAVFVRNLKASCRLRWQDALVVGQFIAG
jgi:hypothetical protein